MKGDITIRLRSVYGPWSKNNDRDEIVVTRNSVWIGTRKGGLMIGGRKTLLALADAIYERMADTEDAKSDG